MELNGRKVLERVDLKIEAGSPLALTGPSGSGKTVLCLVIAGVIRPSIGRVLLDEQPFGHEATSRVGLILQTHGLVTGLTARENVSLPLQARAFDPDEIAARTSDALASVGLAGAASRQVDELSGGERQRVGVARALAIDPVVLVADEPTSELDPDNRERVLELIAGSVEKGRIVVVASDDPEVVSRLPIHAEMSQGQVSSLTES